MLMARGNAVVTGTKGRPKKAEWKMPKVKKETERIAGPEIETHKGEREEMKGIRENHLRLSNGRLLPRFSLVAQKPCVLGHFHADMTKHAFCRAEPTSAASP